MRIYQKNRASVAGCSQNPVPPEPGRVPKFYRHPDWGRLLAESNSDCPIPTGPKRVLRPQLITRGVPGAQ
jgi:hypothetical protein